MQLLEPGTEAAHVVKLMLNTANFCCESPSIGSLNPNHHSEEIYEDKDSYTAAAPMVNFLCHIDLNVQGSSM